MPTPKGDIEKPTKKPWEMDFSAEPLVEPSKDLKPWEMDFTAEAEPRPVTPIVTPELTEAMAGFGADKSPDMAIDVLNFHKETGFNKDFIEKNLDTLKNAKFKRGSANFAKNAPSTNEWAIASVYHNSLAREDAEALTSIEGKVKPKERDIFDVAGEIAEDPATLLPFIGQGIEFKKAVDVLKAAARQAERTEFRARIAAGKGVGVEEGERLPPDDEFRRAPLLDIEEGFELFGPVPSEPRLRVPTEEEDIATLLPVIERSGVETTIAGGVLDIVARAPAFLAEFLVGGEITKPLKPILTRTLGKSLEKVFTKAGRAQLTKRAVELGIKTTAGAGRFAVATPIILGPTIAKNTLENASPGFRFTQKETGELGVILTDEGDDALVALAKGFGDSFVEVISERSGGLFNVAGSAIKKGVANVAIKSSYIKALFKANPDKNPSELLTTFRSLLKKAGWNGVLAEVAEERVAEVGKAIIGTQEYNIPTAKQLTTEIIGFGVFGGGLSAIGGTLEKIAVTRDVERKADIVKNIGEDVKESKLHKRSPELFKEVVDKMAKGTDLENVAIPVAAWDSYWEEQGFDPRIMTEELLGDAGLYDAAIEEDKDIEMSLGTYAAGIAATEHNEPLSEELKVSGAIDISLADELLPEVERPEPPVITPAREARIESARLRKELAEAVEKARIRTEAILEGQIPSESERIVQDVTAQLEATGINTEDARLQAEILYGEPFRLLAERAGLTPEELFEEFGPTIRREGVEEVADEALEQPLVDITDFEDQLLFQAERRKETTFNPTDISDKTLPETTTGLLPSAGEKGEYYHATLDDLQTYIDEHGDGFLYRLTSKKAVESGLDKGNPDYFHRFTPDKKTKTHAFTTSLEDVRKLVANSGETEYIVYRMLASDLANEFTIQIPSDREGEVLHVHSPLPAPTNRADVIARDGVWEERSTDDSRRFIEERRAGERGREGVGLRRGDGPGRGRGIKGAGPRASITFGPTGVSIDLFKKADPTSLFHETGHLYVRVLDDLARREGASEELRQDNQKILKWLDAKSGQKLTVPQQEKWARGIELYFREGKAPTAALRGAFARFKEWFLAVYETALQLDVELSPEIRSVMDRIFASREDIDDISDEVDRAIIDLVVEGKDLAKITEAEIKELVPNYKPVPAKKVKGIVREATGLKRTFKLISEDKALQASFKKAEQAARAAFKAGKKAGVAKETKRMNAIAEKVKTRTDKKIDKILTEKEKIARRKASVRAIRDELGLSDADITKLTRGRRLDLMDNQEFKEFKDRMLFQAHRLVEKQIAKARVIGTIEEKRLQKVDNYRKALKLPTLKNMTTKQLDNWADQLDIFEEGDIFLGKRQIETADLTELKGARTHREVLEILAKKVSKREGREVTIEELQKITPPGLLTKLSFDSLLMQRDPFFRMLVEETTKQLSEGELRAFEIEEELFRLSRASQESQGFKVKVKGFVLPQDKQIMDYMEAEDADKERYAATMTVEQLELVNFMQHYFEGGLEYLQRVGSLERGRENYFTHLRQSFFESIKEEGFLGGIRNIVKNFTDDAKVFTIIDTETGDILPLNKHFKFSMRRGEEGINPTQNVTKAFLVYVRTLEKKKAFDATFPAIDMYVQALAPIQTTRGGVEMDRRFKKFVYEWLNNKKGRRFSFGGVIEQGRTLDLLLTGIRTLTTLRDLLYNVPVQIASIVGEQPANFIVLGAKGIARGEFRQLTKKGKAIVKKHEAILGRSAWQEFFLPGEELPQRLINAGFMIFHINTVKMNKQFFLASLTKEEYDTGKVSTQRVAEIQLDMGRFRVVPGTESILGATSLGKSVNQYKGWAIRLLIGTIKDIELFSKGLAQKPLGEALTAKEAREVYRIAMVVMIATVVAGAGDDEDDTFLGRIAAKSRRELLSLVQSWDPTLWVGWRTLAFVGDIAVFLKEAVTFEKFKTKPGYKAVARGNRMITPAAIAPIFREDR